MWLWRFFFKSISYSLGIFLVSCSILILCFKSFRYFIDFKTDSKIENQVKYLSVDKVYIDDYKVYKKYGLDIPEEEMTNDINDFIEIISKR